MLKLVLMVRFAAGSPIGREPATPGSRTPAWFVAVTVPVWPYGGEDPAVPTVVVIQRLGAV